MVLARATVPKDIIFEAVSLVKRAVHEGKIRKTRGAFFVGVIKRTCADRGIPIMLGQTVAAGASGRW